MPNEWPPFWGEGSNSDCSPPESKIQVDRKSPFCERCRHEGLLFACQARSTLYSGRTQSMCRLDGFWSGSGVSTWTKLIPY